VHPTCWAEATPDALVAQLKACEIWDARPTTKGTPCEPTTDGMKMLPIVGTDEFPANMNTALGECDINMQNGNSCFGSGPPPPHPPTPPHPHPHPRPPPLAKCLG
jgi:hypothetical protein